MANVSIVYGSSESDANKFTSTFDSFIVPPNTLPTASTYFNQILSSFAYTNDAAYYSILNNYLYDNATPGQWDIFTDYYSVGYSGSLSVNWSNIKTVTSVHLASGDAAMVAGNLNYSGLPVYTNPLNGSTITSLGFLTRNSNVAPGNDLYIFLDGTLVKNGNTYSGFFDKYTESIDFPNGLRLDVTLGMQNSATLNFGNTTTGSVSNVRINYVNYKAFMGSGINEIDISYDSPISGDQINFTPESYLSGNDTITTSGNGPIYAYGFAGDDTIFVNGLKDIVDGGTGIDIAVFSGKRSQYVIRSDGEFLAITESTNPSNADKMVNVEFVKFSDQQLSIAELLNPTPTYTLTALTPSILEGEIAQFSLVTTGLQSGSLITYNLSGIQASDLMSNKLSGTATIGYDGRALIQIATISDDLVEGSKRLILTVNNQSAQIILNDDISLKSNGEIYSGENLSIYKTNDGMYVVADSGVRGGETIFDYTTLMSSSNKAYVPKGVVSVFSTSNDEFVIISKIGKTFSEQIFSSSGMVQGKALKLTTAQLLAKEVIAEQDINGDSVIGELVATVLDGDGDATQDVTGLYKTVAGTVVIGAAGLEVSDLVGESTALMASSKKGWIIPKGATVEGIAFTDGGSLEVLTRKGTAFSAQKFDDVTGLMIGKAVKLTTAQLESREYYYDLDLTGDAVVSLIGQESASTGWPV